MKEKILIEPQQIVDGVGIYGDPSNSKLGVAIYDREGKLEVCFQSVKDAALITGVSESGMRLALKSQKIYKNKFFRFYKIDKIIPKEIEVEYLCKINNIKFFKQIEVAKYCGVTRQAVSIAKQHHSKIIGGNNIEWYE